MHARVQAEPIQPQPQMLSATLLTLMKHIRPTMYDFNAANKEGNGWVGRWGCRCLMCDDFNAANKVGR